MRYEFANFGTEFLIQEQDEAKKCWNISGGNSGCLSDMFSVLIKNEYVYRKHENSRAWGSSPQSSEK